MPTTKRTSLSLPRPVAARRRSSRLPKRSDREAVSVRPPAPRSPAKRLPWPWPAGGVLLMLILLWIPFARFVSPLPTRLWRGYYTLLIRAGGAAESRLREALAPLGPGVVSAGTTTVDIYDFSGLTRLPFARLSSRLDPLDPRRDPYIDGMGGFFSVTAGDVDMHAAYIPAHRSAIAVFLSLTAALGPSGRSGWRLVELDPAEKIMSLTSLFVCATVLALASRRRRRGSASLAAAGTLAWVPAIIAGGPAALAICLLLLFFWIPLLQRRLASPLVGGLRRLRAALFTYTAVGVGSIAVFSLLKGSTLGDTLQPVAPFLCSLVLVILAPSFHAVVRSLGRARVFSSVTLLRMHGENGKGRQRVLSLALFCLAVVLLMPLARGGAYPAPLPLLGLRDFSWDAVSRLQERPRTGRLPDFSDLVAHEAYQQTMGFGRTWQYPVEDQRLEREEYSVDPASGVVNARPRTVKSFDSSWLKSLVARPEPGSLEALLLSEGRPVAAAVRGPARTLARELPFTALAVCVLLALLCRDLRLGLLIRGNLLRLMGEARRNQVP